MTEQEMAETLDMIEQLLLAFPAGRASGSADTAKLMPVYVRAVEDFEFAHIQLALSDLTISNPRNPFAPTAQDVYERLKGITGKDPKKPQMLLSEWLNCGTAQIIGHKRAMEVWNEKLSPEAKARAALQAVEGGKNVTPLRLAVPDRD